jgi:hypothetical protein
MRERMVFAMVFSELYAGIHILARGSEFREF